MCVCVWKCLSIQNKQEEWTDFQLPLSVGFMCICTCTCTSLRHWNTKCAKFSAHNMRSETPVDEWDLQQLYNWTYFTANLRRNTYSHASATSEDGASLDITADGLWKSSYERAFFNVCVQSVHPQIPASLLLPPIINIKKNEKYGLMTESTWNWA